MLPDTGISWSLGGWFVSWLDGRLLKSGVRGGGIFSAQGTKAERAGGRCGVLWIQGGVCSCQQGIAAWAGEGAACFLGEGKQRGVHARMETGLVALLLWPSSCSAWHWGNHVAPSA